MELSPLHCPLRLMSRREEGKTRVRLGFGCLQGEAVSHMPNGADLQRRRAAHWRDNRRLTCALLLIWLVATFAVVYWPSGWEFEVFGWPLVFWLTAQGLLLFYGALVWFYDWRMMRIDRRWGLDSPPPSPSQTWPSANLAPASESSMQDST